MGRFLSALALALALLFAAPAMAGTIRYYDANAFAQAQADGLPIVIHVTASWCPTCKAQHPVVQSLIKDPANADLLVFEIDFDTEGALLRQFNVRQQSTLIAFRGKDEQTRSVGVTDPAAIAALFATTH